ncbi:hypothetical protein Tco_1462375, partial [Tanacetum coccineum]
LDVCVDLTESSPLTQTEMADFAPGRAAIDAAQRELEEYAVTLLKRIRKFSILKTLGHTCIVLHGYSFQYAFDVFNATCNVDALSVTTDAFAPHMMKTVAKCYFGVIEKDFVPGLCPSCNVHRMDQWGDHAVHCSSEVGVKFMYNLVRDILVDICSKVGIMVGKEAPMGFLSEEENDLRPADLLLFN